MSYDNRNDMRFDKWAFWTAVALSIFMFALFFSAIIK